MYIGLHVWMQRMNPPAGRRPQTAKKATADG